MNRKLLTRQLSLCVLIFLIAYTPVFAESETKAHLDKRIPSAEQLAIDQSLSGTITNEAGDPLTGATVRAKGTTRGALTDEAGTYKLTVPDNITTLIFSYVGYATQEVEIGGRTVINVSMIESLSTLDEVVVVGYGTQKKSDMTGSVVSIKEEIIKANPGSSVLESLQGRVSGLQITQTNGRPGGNGLEVTLRGLRSLSASNTPLFVIDGVPLADASGASLSDFNVNDIESVEVLKDASSSAIYGSRGSNGVIIITTKRGHSGKPKINYAGFAGPTSITQKIDVFGADEWVEMRRVASVNDGRSDDLSVILDAKMFGAYQRGESYDYQDFIFGEGGFRQSHNLSLTGGNNNLRAAFGAGYFQEDGAMPFTSYERGSFRMNVDYDLSDKITMGTSLNFSRIVEDLRGIGTASSILLPPYSEPFDEQGNHKLFVTDDQTGTSTNPIFELQQQLRDRFNNRLFGNVYLNYQILPWLSYRLNTALDLRNIKDGRFSTSGTRNARSFGEMAFTTGLNYLVENIVTLDQDFGDHSLNATLLYSIQEENFDELGVRVENLLNENLGYNPLNGSAVFPPERSDQQWQLESYMARVRYGFNSKYLLTLTGRLDGSSKFGTGNKYGFFPSAAFAWNIHEEGFLKSPVINQLKLRVSWGQVGNQEIPIYRSLALTNQETYIFGNSSLLNLGLVPARLPNPNLKWEVTTSINVGVDFELFSGRLHGTIEGYQANTEDLLLERQIPITNGFTSVLDNIGETRNRGIDANVGGFVVDAGDFKWHILANFNFNRSEIIALAGELDEEGNPIDDIGNRWFIGEPVLSYYDFEWDGIWQTSEADMADTYGLEPGDIRVVDQDGDGVIDPDEDRVIVGNEQPDWFGGLTSTISFKGIELRVMVNTVQGVFRRNGWLDENSGNLSGRYNAVFLDYWTPNNPSQTAFAPNVNASPLYRDAWAFQDGSFTALKNITLSYDFPRDLLSKINVNQLKIYVTGNNLKYWTNWIGFNPENASRGNYPSVKSWVFGLNLGI